MKRILLHIYFLLAILICSCQTTNKKANLLFPSQLQTIVSTDNSVQIIDVRTPKEFNEGHIPDAVNIDFYSADFASNIAKLNKDKPVYVYCRSGRRSANSATVFEKAGFKEIYDLEGGILNWKSKGFDVLIKN